MWHCSTSKQCNRTNVAYQSNVAMWHIKIWICRTKMTKKNIQYCSLMGMGRTTVLQAQGRRGFDGIVGSGASQGWRCRRLGEDDGTAGQGTVLVNGVASSRMASGAQYRRLIEDNIVVGSGTSSQSWGWHLRGRRRHQLGSGKMVACKGARPWLRMMARMLRGGLNDGTDALGKFLTGNFGSLTAWVKSFRD
jgi:hypothetical protein